MIQKSLDNVIFIIPVYKKIIEMNFFELNSITHIIKSKEKINISFTGPKCLKDSYLNYFDGIIYNDFPDFYFRSIKGYNNLLKSKLFYFKFVKYDFMFIVQTDAWILGDIEEINKFYTYDFYGAPSINNGELDGYNGGFSLRNVKKSIRVLRSYKRSESWNEIVKRHFYEPSRYLFIWKWFSVLFDYFVRKIVASPFNRFDKGNEDFFWSVNVPKAVPSFKVNDFETALKFSWEHKCAEFYNKYPLPFGCHGWWNYNYDFWKDFIKIDERQDSH
jgi:hypothetical protein